MAWHQICHVYIWAGKAAGFIIDRPAHHSINLWQATICTLTHYIWFKDTWQLEHQTRYVRVFLLISKGSTNTHSKIHPCEKIIGMFFQNQIWSRCLDIIRLCLVCIKRSIEEVKKCQISKHGYHQGPSDETMKKARCQFCDVKFGHRIMRAVCFFDYKIHIFI